MLYIISYLFYALFTLLQQYILVALVFKYKKMLNQNNMTCVGAYWIIVCLFGYQICPRFLLSMAVVSNFHCNFVVLFAFCFFPKKFLQIILQICFFFFPQPFCTPIGATSKVLQLMEILRSKDSTTVSLTTWFLSAFTNLSMFCIPLVVGASFHILNEIF